MINKTPDILQEITQVSPLIKLLGADRVEDIKDNITQIIIQKVKSDIKNWSQYLFYPPDHEWIIKEAVEEVTKKLKKMYKDAMLEVAERSIMQFKQQCCSNQENKTDAE